MHFTRTAPGLVLLPSAGAQYGRPDTGLMLLLVLQK